MANMGEHHASDAAAQCGVVVVGAGVVGWLSACFLKCALPGLRLRVLELPRVPDTEPACAAPPELHQLIFEPLGVSEADWMHECNAAPHAAVSFVNWRKPRTATPDDHFFHVLSPVPELEELSLHHHWLLRRGRGERQPMEYACFKEPRLLEARLAPCFNDGSSVMRHGWQLEPARLARYLRTLAEALGVEVVAGELESVSRSVDGAIAALRLRGARVLEADLYLDCSGRERLLLGGALAEPFRQYAAELGCDRMLSGSVAPTGVAEGVDPFVSAIAMSSGWVAKLPLLERFVTSYVYDSAFSSDEAALRELCWLWGLSQPPADLRSRRVVTERAEHAWSGNCVGVGDACSFVEPLRAGELQRACDGLRLLLAHFPGRSISPALRARYNVEVARAFEELRDSTQLLYVASPRRDSPFWLARQHELRVAPSLRAKLESYGPALPVDTPTPLVDRCPSGSGYCSVLAGMGWLPKGPLPSLLYRPELQRRAERIFSGLRQDSDQLYALLPTNHEWLRRLHSDRIDRSGSPRRGGSMP